MAFERTTARRARKERPCHTYRCSEEVIRPGELYNEHVASPGSYDWGEVASWRRFTECGTCAEERTGKPITRES